METSTTAGHRVVPRSEWLAERRALLAREKELTRASDEMDRLRRELPWVRVDKSYSFEGPGGSETLADLFDGRSQLIVNHFMLGPGWKEGCVGCSFGADHVDGARVHLEHHDVSYVAVSRAPLPEIQAFKDRMGWRFKWVSSFACDFNYDYGVSFSADDMANGRASYNYGARPADSEDLSGLSVFFKDPAGQVFHTYACFARGGEKTIGAYMLLDLTPKGRNEAGPRHDLSDWVRHHDRYGSGGRVDATGRYRAHEPGEPCGHDDTRRS